MMKSTFNLSINDHSYHVIVTYKKMKRMYLRLDEEQNLLISCPVHTAKSQICAFIEQNQEWIARQFQKQENTTIQKDMTSIDIFGVSYPLIFQESPVIRLEKTEGALYCYGIKPQDPSFRSLFYHEAAKWIVPYVQNFRKQWDKEICEGHGKPYPKMTLKYMTSRWGSCTPAKSHISLSVRLIHYPIICLEYVLLHEYVHLLVPNHSKAFYDMVERYMPSYRDAIRLLK